MNDRNQSRHASFAIARFNFLTAFVALLACVWANTSNAHELRTWTSSTGVQVEATFKELSVTEVRLISKEGKLGKFPLVSLSEPDQKYVKELNAYLNRKNRGEAVEPPVDPRKDATPIDVLAEIKKEKPKGDAFDEALGEDRAAKPKNVEAPNEPLMTFAKRTWKSTKGKSVEGRLYSASGDKVYILDTTTNRVLPAPVASLSDKDRDYVKTQLRGLGRNDLLVALNLPKEEPPIVNNPPQQVAGAPAGNQAPPNPPVAAPNFQPAAPPVVHVPNNQFAARPHFQHRMQAPQMNNGASDMMEQMRAQSQQRMQESQQRMAQMQAESQQRMQEMQQRSQESLNRMRQSQQANMQTWQNRTPTTRTSISPGWGTPTSTPAASPVVTSTTTKNAAYETGRQVGRIAGILLIVVVVVGCIAKLAQS